MKRLPLLVWLVAAGCRCPPPAPAPDAAPPAIERSTDLRSSLQLIFPEYRGVHVLQTTATYARRVEPATAEDLAQAKALAAQNGFNGEPLTRAPFTLNLEPEGNALTMTLVLPIKEEEIGRIYAAPASMSSQAMANWLPKLKAPIARDVYTLDMTWQSVRPARAAFLNWQLVDGLLRGGWRGQALPPGYDTDAGTSTVPDPFKATLVEPTSGGQLELDRAGDTCRLHYTLVTR